MVEEIQEYYPAPKVEYQSKGLAKKRFKSPPGAAATFHFAAIAIRAVSEPPSPLTDPTAADSPTVSLVRSGTVGYVSFPLGAS